MKFLFLNKTSGCYTLIIYGLKDKQLSKADFKARCLPLRKIMVPHYLTDFFALSKTWSIDLKKQQKNSTVCLQYVSFKLWISRDDHRRKLNKFRHVKYL